MTEKEYVNAKALGTITSSINTLKDLVPENLEGIIDERYLDIMNTLYEYQEKLFDTIELD
jgi:hypothetical protein